MNKKKLWKQMTVLSICTMVASALPVYAQSQMGEKEVVSAGKSEENADFEIKDGVLVAYHGNEHVPVVPEGVEVIGRRAFAPIENDIGIYDVKLPNSLKKIEEEAFMGSSLEEITIPEGVTEIGNRAFGGCMQLYKIVLPKSITSIGGEAAFSHTELPGAGHMPDKYPILYAAPGSYVQEFAADYGYTFRDIALVDEPLPTKDQLSDPTRRIMPGNNCDKPPVQTKDQEDERPKPNKVTKPAKQKLTVVKSKKAKQLIVSWKRIGRLVAMKFSTAWTKSLKNR